MGKRKKGKSSQLRSSVRRDQRLGAEQQKKAELFSAYLKVVKYLRERWVVVKGSLIFAGGILIFLFIYPKLTGGELFLALRSHIASATGFFLDLTGVNAQVTGAMVTSPDFSMSIIAACTGIVPTAIVISAVLAYPSTIRQKIEGIALGIVCIYAFNLVRMVSLFLVGSTFPNFFESAHYIVGQSIMILLAIGLWLFWVEKRVHVTIR